MMRRMKKKFLMSTRIFLVLLCGLWLISPAWALDPNPKTIRLALLPDESPDNIIKVNQPFKNYLERTLDKKIKLIVTTDYSSMIEAFRHEKLEAAYFGPLSYCMLKARYQNVEPFAAKMKHGKTTYHSVLIVPSESDIHFIWQLKGRNVAFGDPASTSSHLIPKQMLAKFGQLNPEKDFISRHLGVHDAVAMAVMNGKVAAGGLSLSILQNLMQRGVIPSSKVRQLQISAPIPEYPFVFRNDLDGSLKESMKVAFYNLKDNSILKPLRAEGFAPIQDKDYDIIRETAKILNMSLAK